MTMPGGNDSHNDIWTRWADETPSKGPLHKSCDGCSCTMATILDSKALFYQLLLIRGHLYLNMATSYPNISRRGSSKDNSKSPRQSGRLFNKCLPLFLLKVSTWSSPLCATMILNTSLKSLCVLAALTSEFSLWGKENAHQGQQWNPLKWLN